MVIVDDAGNVVAEMKSGEMMIGGNFNPMFCQHRGRAPREM